MKGIEFHDAAEILQAEVDTLKRLQAVFMSTNISGQQMMEQLIKAFFQQPFRGCFRNSNQAELKTSRH